MVAVRWTAFALLALGFLWIAGLNNWALLKWIIRRKRQPSWIPLLGGALGAVACVAVPVDHAAHYWWVPLLLDWGSLPGILFSVGWLVAKRGQHSGKEDEDDGTNG